MTFSAGNPAGNEHQELVLPQFWYRIFELSKIATPSVPVGYWLARHRFGLLQISGYHFKRFCPTHLRIGHTKARIQGPVRPKQLNPTCTKIAGEPIFDAHFQNHGFGCMANAGVKIAGVLKQGRLILFRFTESGTEVC